MTRVVLLLLLCLAPLKLTPNARAADRLFALSAEDKRDDYYVILQRVFHRIYEDDVVLSVLFAIGTGHEEFSAGIKASPRGFEAFSVSLSASVWSTEYERFMAGGKETCYDAATNKQIPCPPPKREKGLPKSYRGIKTVMKTRRLPQDLAMRITKIWQLKVQEALNAPRLTEDERGLSSLSEYYSVRSNDHNWMTALATAYDKNSDAARISSLAGALQGYAMDAVSLKELLKASKDVESGQPHH